MRVVGYLRVSTVEQADSRLGLDAQRSTIQAEADRRGWEVVWVEDAGRSGRDLVRPGIDRAMELLRSGEAGGLVVAKLDRLSRSLMDFAALMARANREGWRLVALPRRGHEHTGGEMVANVMASFAQYERRLIGQRTREALQARRASGLPLGRPRVISVETVAPHRGPPGGPPVAARDRGDPHCVGCADPAGLRALVPHPGVPSAHANLRIIPNGGPPTKTAIAIARVSTEEQARERRTSLATPSRRDRGVVFP